MLREADVIVIAVWPLPQDRAVGKRDDDLVPVPAMVFIAEFKLADGTALLFAEPLHVVGENHRGIDPVAGEVNRIEKSLVPFSEKSV